MDDWEAFGAKLTISSISGTMTGALCIYSATFMRYSLAVTPANYLLFGCHFVNEGAQLTQGYRWLNYNKWGGKEKEAEETLKSGVNDAKALASEAADKAKGVVEAAKEKLSK
jgi:hypothetical protein